LVNTVSESVAVLLSVLKIATLVEPEVEPHGVPEAAAQFAVPVDHDALAEAPPLQVSGAADAESP
jgi:hypothetical protein